MATSRSGTSWGALLLAAFLLLLVSPADGRRHLIRHGRQRRQHQHNHVQQNVTLGMNPGSYQESGPWGPWTANSSCSRTCGGGVAYQTRVCEDFRDDGTHGCVGPSKRYFSCNVEECPDYTKDFREEQCARLNSIPFEGRNYSWVPFYKAANPCELNCRPLGERFYYRHSAKTIDGTRCHDDGSLDVCVNGACMPVGCDKMLGSDAVEDKCRKCRGGGTSCSTIEGFFDLDNLEIGYNDILLIPTGATNIRIEEKFPTNNYLAVRNTTGYYYLNGNWRVEFPRSVRFAGTVFHYERRNHGANAPESLVALGPTSETILIVLLYQEKNLGITYEYSVPAGVSRPQPAGAYNWNSGDFGECSQTCGGGTQSRVVYCSSAVTLDKVSDDLCNPTISPQATRVCNPEPCPASYSEASHHEPLRRPALHTWYVGEWEECSETCGNGTQLRLVFCQHRTECGSVLTKDSQCLDSVGPKPERLRECSSETECATWEVGNWTECSTPCGGGQRTRTIICHVNGKPAAPMNCDACKRPFDSESCNMNACDDAPPTRRPPKHGFVISKDACKRMADPGSCQQVHARWFYDVKIGRCLPFVYTGCGGNKNRFRSAEICMSYCQGVTMDTVDFEVDEDKTRMMPEVSPARRDPPDAGEDMDPRVKPPTFVTPVPKDVQAKEPLPRQTAAPECLPSNCEEMQCPLGKNQTVDHRGCVQCHCSNPCETFSCSEEELCSIEEYRSEDGRPNYRPVCRLVPVPATIVPSDARVTVTVSETARLACVAMGYPRPTVQWYRGGKLLPRSSARYATLGDFTLAIRNVTLEDEDIYMCRAYNYLGDPAFWKVSLTVVPLSSSPARSSTERRRR